MRILLSGGGTGGHVYPILAVIDALKQMNAEAFGDIQTRAALPGGGRPVEQQPRQTEALPKTGVLAESDTPDPVTPVITPVDFALLYAGEAGGIEEALAARAGIAFSAIATGQIRGRGPGAALRNLVKMARGTRQCRTMIREFRPDVAFLTGGYVAAPVAWAAWQRARAGIDLSARPDAGPSHPPDQPVGDAGSGLLP